MTAAVHNIINGELRPATATRTAGPWQLPLVNDREVALAIKVATTRGAPDRKTAIEALRAIGRESTWMSHEQCVAQAVSSRTPLHHIKSNVRTVNSWLASIGDYVDRVAGAVQPSANGTLTYVGGIPTMCVLAGNEFMQAPWVITNALLAGAPAIVKPSGVDPCPPFWFTSALLAHGIASIQLLYLDSSTPAGRQQVRTALTATGQSVVFGEDATIAAVYDGCPGLHRHKAIPFWTGRAAAIVYGDADLAAASLGLVEGATYSSGRNCLSTKKVFCSERIADALEQHIVAELRKLRRGPVDDEYVDLGPINEDVRAHVLAAATKDTVLYDDDALVVRCSPASSPCLLVDEQPCPLLSLVRAPDDALIGLANGVVERTPSRRAMSIGVWTARRERFDATAAALAAYKVVWNGPTNPWSVYTAHEGINLFHELMRPKAICAGRPSFYELGKPRLKPWPW